MTKATYRRKFREGLEFLGQGAWQQVGRHSTGAVAEGLHPDF